LTPKADAGLGKVTATHVKMVQRAFGVRDPELDSVTDKKGNILPDDALTDYENVPMVTDIHDYLETEVLPHAEDAYIDEGYRDEIDGGIGIVGYEISFNRYFYEYQPPRDLEEIDADLNAVEAEIAAILSEVTE
jgi:type I restriction enzyme M protein